MSENAWLDVLKWIVPPGIGLGFVWKLIEKRIERGRRRVEEEVPKIIALGNRAPSPSLALELKNQGQGEARNVIFALDGCNGNSPPLASIMPGCNATTGQLFYNGSQFCTQAINRSSLYIRYQSAHGLTYQTIYVVTQQLTDRGDYTPQIDWQSKIFKGPDVDWRTYFKIGK